MMLDIGYLLDVPMASHRYTKQWPPMMDEYFFRERRPEFIHIRRDWGERTTIPMNPKFQEQYVALPEDEHFGRVPNGNFLRRDLIESDHAPERTIAVEPFSNGLKLVGVEAPAAARPGEKTPIFLIWAATAPLPSLRFQIALVRAGQTPTWQEYEPAMGWLPTSDWKPGAFVREVVMLEAPDTEGRYQLMIGVLGGNSAAETRTLPVEIEVGSTAAQQETDRLLAQARELAARDPAGADLAVGLMRQAERIMGEKSLREETAAIDQARLNTYVTAAQKAADAQSWREAADFLSRAWRIDAKSKPLRDLGWRVAGVLYKMGRHEQAQQNWEAAYQAYSAACRAQPQHAWARRRAEEVRPRRY
jgi:hypothetical protein